MVYIDTQVFNVNRILLLMVGMWPYHRSKLVELHVILFFSILMSAVVFQLAIFLIVECTSDVVTEVLSSTLVFAIYIIKYNTFWYNNHSVKYLLEEIERIYNELKDKKETSIIENCGCTAKRYTIAITLLLFGNLVMITIPSIWSSITVFLLINGSQSYNTQITTDYFVDHGKYFYIILLLTNAAFYIGTVVLGATGTMLVSYCQHARGLFKIASYRIEHAIESNITQNIDLKNEIVNYEQIIQAVDIHCEAMKYSTCVISSFEGSLIALTFCAIVCLSLNFYRICQIISFGGKMEKLLLHLMYVFMMFLYGFLSHYNAEQIMDSNNNIYTTAYNSKWYVTPIHMQRIILFLLQRRTKVFNLNLGGIIIASMETLSKFISMAISYFTLLYSIQ